MNAIAIELALKRQKLQFSSDSLRGDLARHTGGLAPIFSAADRVADGADWLRRHPQIFVAVGVALVVARPRRAWRWTRRAFIGWQTWRRFREAVAKLK